MKIAATSLFCLFMTAFAMSAQSVPTSSDLEQKARMLISQMTLEEKISQMVNSSAAIDRLGIKQYDWWSEALHGVARTGVATVFPMPIGLGATFNPELVESVGDIISTEARAKYEKAQSLHNYGRYAGLTFWSPNINIFRDPRWGRGMETYGEDPYLTGQMGLSFVRGLQGRDPLYLKVAACAKHFAVHSGPESLRHSFDVAPSLRDLYETYLPAFETLVTEGHVEAVMSAYNRVYGESATASPFLLTEILRNKWGFEGHVVSDCGAVYDIYNGHAIAPSATEASAMAVKAGLNVNCGNSLYALVDAVDRGLVTEEDIDQALLPLFMTRLKLGALTDSDYTPYKGYNEDLVACSAHAQVARLAAQESMVLLKNDGALPVKKDSPFLFVSGCYSTDVQVLLGNYYGIPARAATFLEGIASKVSVGTTVMHRVGFQPTVENVVIQGVPELAGGTAFIFLGLGSLLEGEEGDAIASVGRGDKLDLKIPQHQIDYLRLICEDPRRTPDSKVVAVVVSGSPVELGEICDLADAVVLAWYPGQEGGDALADLLFGDASFSGRLPVTFPADGSKLPDFEDYSMKDRTYKYMTDNICFPFGYGLTYGHVNYDSVEACGLKQRRNRLPKMVAEQPLKLKVSLTNDGNADADEVVQIYMAAPGAGISAPLESLVAFKKVPVAAGSSVTVDFEIPFEMLKTVQQDGSKEFAKGEYTFTASAAAPCARSNELMVSSASVKMQY